MSKITIENFVGTRTRFQRLRDAKLFSGWIESYVGNVIVLSTNTNYAVNIGDQFRIEGYGHKVSMVVNARLNEIGRLDINKESLVTEVQGTNARILEAKRIHLQMSVVGPVRFAATEESLRIKAPMLPILVEQGEVQVQGYCVDAGLQGFGFVTDCQLVSDTEVKAQIQTKHGMVVCKGNLRYCIKDRDRDDMYRCGVHISPLERTMAPRWDAFLNDIG